MNNCSLEASVSISSLGVHGVRTPKEWAEMKEILAVRTQTEVQQGGVGLGFSLPQIHWICNVFLFLQYCPDALLKE